MRRRLAVGLLSVMLLGGCSKQASPPGAENGVLPTSSTTENRSKSQPRYLLDSETVIDQAEAIRTPPVDQWPVLKELSNTAAIDVLCHPKSTQIRDPQIVAEAVRLLQGASYIEAAGAPRGQLGIKVYFKRPDDSFIMAARLFLKESRLESPEGPWIKADPRVVELFLADGVCRPQ